MLFCTCYVVGVTLSARRMIGTNSKIIKAVFRVNQRTQIVEDFKFSLSLFHCVLIAILLYLAFDDAQGVFVVSV